MFEKLLLGKTFEDISKLYDWGIGKIGDDKALVTPLHVRRVVTKNGDDMAFAHITDGDTILKLTIFPKTWEKIENLVSEYRPLLVKLSLLRDGGWTINETDIVDAMFVYNKKMEKLSADK